jgi:tripartite-type tricarboxylate transporter receptor subunit TctC
VQKLSSALQTALASPDLAKSFAEISTDPATRDQATPAALQQLLLSEIERLAPLIHASGQYAD